MSHDTRRLLLALENYEHALQRQIHAYRADIEALRASWGRLSAVYEGTAAEQFRAGWTRTLHMLEDYIATGERILPTLRERIAHLREADRPDLSLG